MNEHDIWMFLAYHLGLVLGFLAGRLSKEKP